MAEVLAPAIPHRLGVTAAPRPSCMWLCTHDHLWRPEPCGALEGHDLPLEPAGMVPLPVAGILRVHGVQPPESGLTQEVKLRRMHLQGHEPRVLPRLRTPGYS